MVMNVTLLERFLICYLVVFFGLRFSDDSMGAIGIIGSSGTPDWFSYIIALVIAGLYLIITTAGKK